jgi:hypothetical protein
MMMMEVEEVVVRGRGVWTREGSKTGVADHKAKGGAVEGQGVVVVVVVVVVVPAGVVLFCRCSRGA